MDSTFYSEVACVIILYYPDKGNFGNIISYTGEFNDVWIFDNSEVSDPEFVSGIKAVKNFHYYHEGENKGIAKRLNQACALAIEKGYKWLLSMDQDSQFSSSNLGNYKLAFVELSNSNIAMAGTEYDSKDRDSGDFHIEDCYSLITSGSIVSLKYFSVLGGFKEEYFIDEVDTEYCLRALKMKLRIVLVKGVFIRHTLGQINRYKSLKNLSVSQRSLHSPVRIYYMTRNYLDMRKNYKSLFPDFFKKRDGVLLNRIKNNLLYSPRRFKVLAMAINGFWHFWSGKFGKLKDV